MNTLNQFLIYTSQKFGDLEAYAWAQGDDIVSKTYAEFRDDAAKMADFITKSFGTRKKIALIGDTSYSWVCTYYGIMCSSNITVPTDVKLSPEQIANQLNFADVSIIFLSKKYDSLRDYIFSNCKKVEAILTMEDYPDAAPDTDAKLENMPVDPDALASLMFTSGTSGDGLKAAMITHRGIIADVIGPVPLCDPGDRLLSVLPIHHCFEIFVGQMKYLYLGATICINDSMANLIPNLTRFGITIVVAVPALANLTASLIAQSLKVGKTMPEIKKMLGGKLRRITIGGASASKEVIEILAKAGITVFVGYGLTESTGGCLANCDASIRPLEAGAPYVDGMEMKLCDGELCLRGPMIMQGYYKMPALTSKVMEGDWFHTGDLAEITEENYVIILGRKDNMIKTADGEKIYPEAIEDKLLNTDGVASAMVCAVNNHLAAILYLKDNTEENQAAVRAAIDKLNETLPNYSKIPDVRFRSRPFPMTTSLKIRRAEVMKELAQSDGVKKPVTPPQNEAQSTIADWVMQLLPNAGEIGIDENLFDCGLDSLTAIHLAVLMHCDPTVIYECKTIEKLSEYKSSENTNRSISDGMKVAGINKYISPAISEKPCGDVLFTGASGYLGIHLLNEWKLSDKKAVCLVRSKESFEKSREYYGIPESTENIELIVGDITKDRLGLSPEAYEQLCDRIGTVVHAAALVSHVGNNEESYKVNVEGTQEIIRFCAKANAQLYYISSYAVSGFNSQKALTEDLLDIGQEIIQNPYIQTKYQAEEQVLLARDKGVLSSIYRIGNLTERSSDGKFQKNASESGMAAQLRAFSALSVYPESMSDVLYDSTAVDEAAKAVAVLAESEGTGHIRHIMNPNVKSIEQLTGASMISDAEFALKLSENSTDRDVAILSIYYRMKQDGFNTGFDITKTLGELTKLGFNWSDNKGQPK